MLDYSREASRYDATRGGDKRADAAAAAIRTLIPAGTATVLDVACGTGIVSMRLAENGRRIIGVDRAEGMLTLARTRLPEAVICGDATQLPLASASVDAVVMVWLLHLLTADQVEHAIAEAVRVLRPAGTLITTVNKNDAAYDTGSDVADVLSPPRAQLTPPQRDAPDTIITLGQTHSLTPVGESTFTGHGQGRSPRWWINAISTFQHPWTRAVTPELLAELHRQLAALPDQDTPRTEPVYRLLALQKTLTRSPGYAF